MKAIDDHRLKLKEIADIAFMTGIDWIKAENLSTPNKWNEDVKKKFKQKCHDGFKTAQKLLIEEVTYYQSKHREFNTLLKEFRRKKDKEEQKKMINDIKIIEARLNTFSHIADSIAWQLIGGQIHIARRFHINENGTKFLDFSNIKHAVQVADTINKNPDNFALISDLTSFLQIGDLLIAHENSFGVMELKEGTVNDQIADFFQKFEEKGETFEDQKLEDKYDAKTIKQIERMHRQKQRTNRIVEIINTDKGTDPISEQEIQIKTPDITTEYYHDTLNKLEEDLKSKFWAYTNVDACLHIGMYRDEGLVMAKFTVEQLLKEKTENYIIIDWLSITQNLSEPIFAKPLSADFIIDVLTGKIKVILGLNLDIFIEILNSFGIEATWMSNKETLKMKEEMKKIKRNDIFIFKSKGVKMIFPNNMESVLAGGLISKILFDNIKPINIALTLASMYSKS